MAELSENGREKEEKKIPVFTVFKNKAILKNIFLNCPSPNQENQEEEEMMVLIGRHPDCKIKLDHPSISRFHLRLYSKTSSNSLSLIDLSSVHGTWVSGKKIAPGVRVELNEGDTVRLGGSSRIYRLHWVPISHAYDLDNPYVPPTDMLLPVKESEERDQNESCDDMEYFSLLLSPERKVSPSSPPMPELVNSSCSDEAASENRKRSTEESEENEISGISTGPLSNELIVAATESQQSDQENEDPEPGSLEILTERESAKSHARDLEESKNLLEFFNTLLFEDQVENLSSSTIDHEHEEIWSHPISIEPLDSSTHSAGTLGSKDQSYSEKKNHHLQNFLGAGDSATKSLDNTPKKSDPELTLPGTSSHSLSDEGSCLAGTLGSKDQSYSEKQNHHLQNFLAAGASATKSLDNTPKKSDPELNLPGTSSHSLSDEGSCLVGYGSHVVNNKSSLQDDFKQKELPDLGSGDPLMDFPLSGDNISKVFGTEQLDEGYDEVESQTLEINLSPAKDIHGSPEIKSEQRSEMSSIWSRRGKPTCVQIVTGNQEGINMGVELLHKEDMGNETYPTTLFSNVDGDEEEIFTPDKENFITNPLILSWSIKRTTKAEEIKKSVTRFSPLKISSGCNINSKDNTFSSSDKENYTPEILDEQKLVRTASRSNGGLEPEVKARKSRVDRVPFQSMLADSVCRSSSCESRVPDASGSSNSVNNAETVEKNALSGYNKRWIMVADTNSLLNKESRKALQLLRGLKGTHLIIPQIVIRDLDCMKQSCCLLRKATAASSALQWIEDCLLNTNWWIQVQSSVEEGRHLAPTPSASLLSSIKEKIYWDFPVCSAPLSALANLLEIASPLSADHIVECALLFKKMKHDEQLVLLSDDVSLKIKAMAEGVLCESAKEFRDSLVNPFSERFLWAKSSPRGLTWSCVDDIVLREKYYHGLKPSKSGQRLKGLKLILFYNSQFQQKTSVEMEHM